MQKLGYSDKITGLVENVASEQTSLNTPSAQSVLVKNAKRHHYHEKTFNKNELQGDKLNSDDFGSFVWSSLCQPNF